LALILLIYLGLALAYSVVTPIGRGADEWAHYWYAQFIAEHGRLPATPAERESAGYKSDWPPLYHTLAAAVTGWIDTAGPPAFKYRADSLRRQLAPADGSDAILHTLDEQFPWRQEILVWHLGRLLSIVFSAGTVGLTYFIGLEVFLALLPNSPPVTRAAANDLRFTIYDLRVTPAALALIAAAVLAFTPRFIFTGMLFNYDSLTLLLSALFLGLSIRVAGGYYSRWGFWALGAVAGLALMTKYLAALLPVIIIYVAWVKATELHSPFTRHHSLFIIRRLGQAALAYLLVVGAWFGYLIVTFNEVAKYGPILGTLAPLLRGDGSDRTIETLFAWLSGGQAPPPAHIEVQSYGAGQIIASFFSTLWGNPLGQPYPLNWFIVAMTLVMGLALIGLMLHLRFTTIVPVAKRSGIYELRLRQFTIHNLQFTILLLTCLLPTPFMLMRLFGARDALEAVQGRHILFLAGPALAILLVWGLAVIGHRLALLAAKIHHKPISHSSFTIHYSLFTILLALLLTGSLGQLLAMTRHYPPPLPVSAAAPPPSEAALPVVMLPGRATLLDYRLEPEARALRATLFWQGGPAFAPEDYRTEWQLIDSTDQPVTQWSGWQTQGRYPTRAWEPGDVVQDIAWLPLDNPPPGEYTVQWRLLGAAGPLFDWQSLGRWQIVTNELGIANDEVTVWRNGQPARFPRFAERETAQLIFNPKSTIQNPKLIGPDGREYTPVSTGPGWANFIIEPSWPAGSYALAGQPVLAVAASRRDFQPPPDITALEADFAGQIKLLGYRLPARRAEPGDGLPITLIWQAQAWLGEDLVMFTRLLDQQQAAHGGYDRRARENYSTLLWAPGEVITDGFAVPIAADAPPGVYWLSLGWYRPTAGAAESLPLIDPHSGQPTGVTAVTIGPLKVGGPPPGATVAQAHPQQITDIAFGDEIRLMGFDRQMGEAASPNPPNPPNSPHSLTLTLYWQALRPPAVDYTVFTHVRDLAGNVLAQKDQPPLSGAYPTGLWDAGEIIADNISVPLEGLPPGEYQVVVGLYNFADGQRLPVDGVGDETVLDMIEVQ
jgi:4-amino-4-deoxy-L-arabinose transferase-like glycosyltransferase